MVKDKKVVNTLGVNSKLGSKPYTLSTKVHTYSNS